jgi:hypothetical protein
MVGLTAGVEGHVPIMARRSLHGAKTNARTADCHSPEVAGLASNNYVGCPRFSIWLIQSEGEG